MIYHWTEAKEILTATLHSMTFFFLHSNSKREKKHFLEHLLKYILKYFFESLLKGIILLHVSYYLALTQLLKVTMTIQHFECRYGNYFDKNFAYHVYLS